MLYYLLILNADYTLTFTFTRADEFNEAIEISERTAEVIGGELLYMAPATLNDAEAFIQSGMAMSRRLQPEEVN